MNKLLEFIKQSKKYKSISEDLINQEIKKYFQINPKDKQYLDKAKSKKYKGIVKSIKTRLHLS